MNNIELSQDRNNPTIIPYFNAIKLVGNSACALQHIDLQTWHNGIWTRGGAVVYFNSFATGMCSTFVAYENPEGNHGRPLYNETVQLQFAIHNDDNHIDPAISPVYYVVYLDFDSVLVDFAVNGLFETVKLAGDQLIIEVKNGYIFDGSDMVLRDLTEGTVYSLGIWSNNPDCVGVRTNRIVYSNLPLNIDNTYELTIPLGAVISETELDDSGIRGYKYNREYVTGRLCISKL